MSYKLKLAAAVATAALALPAIAVAQDPSTRTDIYVIGAVSADRVEAVADANATASPDLPIVYDDAAPADTDEEADERNSSESTAASAADLGHAVETE